MAFARRPRTGLILFKAPEVRRQALFIRPHLVDWARRYGAARGLHRVFGPAVYRFYRSSSGPPLETDAPFATSATLPATPGTVFADGTWFLAVSSFNGLVDSGFLPVGPNGEAFVRLVVSAGGVGVTPPAAPLSVRLELLAGGVVRVVALYAETGSSRANTWAIAYTVDGSAPAAGAPTTTLAFRSTSAPELLVLDLPAQVTGTTVKVLVQARKGSSYSTPGAVVSAIADATGPSEIPGGDVWRGDLPEGSA